MATDSASAAASLAERIKEVRLAHGLTQQKMAAALGVSRSYLSEVETGSGKPSIEMIVGIATNFRKVSLSWLLTGSGEIDYKPFVLPSIDHESLYIAIYRCDRWALERERLGETIGRAVRTRVIISFYTEIESAINSLVKEGICTRHQAIDALFVAHKVTKPSDVAWLFPEEDHRPLVDQIRGRLDELRARSEDGAVD